MDLSILIRKTKHLVRDNAPTILTALGVAGTLTTAYFASQASYKAALTIKEIEDKEGPVFGTKEKAKKYVPVVWKYYIPAGLAGTATIACVISANTVGSRRMAAAASAYALAERGFSEYREKVMEQIGEKKEEAIRDKIAQETVTNNPLTASNQVVALAGGQVRCCELMTRRYFDSDMETLRRAENDINALINNDMYATVSEFYGIIGIPETSVSNNIGWDSNQHLKLKFTTTLTEDGLPCLAFDYNYTKPLV